MSLLETFSPHTEIYSIDEAFLDLTGICQQDPLSYGNQIKHTIQRDVGIPVCVRMAPTKTLAKQPVQQMHDKFSVVMARTIMELNGIPCLELEEIAPDKQQIICSSSFSGQ